MEDTISKILFISIIVLVVILLVTFFTNNKKPNHNLIITTVKESDELVTAKIKFTGVKEYKDKGIFLLNKSDFLMVYDATANVGINLEKVDISINDLSKVIDIKIPEPTILEVHVDNNNIKYYDEKFSLFNFDSKEDADKAQADAETEAKKKLSEMGIVEVASTQAEKLMIGIVSPLANGYEIKVEFIKEK